MSDVRTHNVISVKTGAKHPRQLQAECTDPFQLRGWQQEAHECLAKARLRRLLAPTGAGKSIAMESLALTDMQAGFRCIVAVPMTDIMHGFARTKRVQVRDQTLNWAPMVVDGDSGGTTNAVLEWLRGDAQGALICTHTTLRNVHALAKSSAELRLFERLSVFIDEGHHSEDDDDETGRNKLAELLNDVAETSHSRLLVTTATWVRRDNKAVVANIQRFTTYHLGALRYLEEVAKIETIHFRYLIGAELDSFSHLLREDPKRPTLVYLRMGQSRAAKLACFDGLAQLADRAHARYLDLVNDGPERQARERSFYTAEQNTTDVVVALAKANEGSDWARCSRELFLAPRGSVPQMLQMIGRALRRFAGKREVEINIVIPPDVPTKKLRDYLKVLCATLVLAYQFKAPRLRQIKEASEDETDADRAQRHRDLAHNESVTTAHALMADPDFASTVAPMLIDLAARCAHPDTIMKALASRATEFEDLQSAEVRASLLQMIAGSTAATKRALHRAIADAEEIDMDVSLEESVLWKIRMLGARLGCDDLRKIRVSQLAADPLRAQQLAQEAAKWRDAMGIKTLTQWLAMAAQRPEHLPSAPWKWLGISSGEFFGKRLRLMKKGYRRRRVAQRNLTEEQRAALVKLARDWCAQLGITSRTEWLALAKRRPAGIPSKPWALLGTSSTAFFGTDARHAGGSSEQRARRPRFSALTEAERHALVAEARTWAKSVEITETMGWLRRSRERPRHLPEKPWELVGWTPGQFFETRVNVRAKALSRTERKRIALRVVDIARASGATNRRKWYIVRRQSKERLPHNPWEWLDMSEKEFFTVVRAGLPPAAATC